MAQLRGRLDLLVDLAEVNVGGGGVFVTAEGAALASQLKLLANVQCLETLHRVDAFLARPACLPRDDTLLAPIC